ncbi:low molecular weight protein-tyrosine-phosphatase [Sanyastnella coralliicola]|uniref:low molecular weight protein-tyrosine-phosphatase n=1 Tax=Sanyastnella coralliicola TaxID=3069118 RepID=UPI0027B9E454|nr:low molecular weight protein-tyrosine-phosphatase [Longitalea sp. SCSIO 12813]
MKHRAEEAGLDVFVDSAGTSGWHEGELPDRRSIEIMRAFDLDITDQRSRPVRQSDFEDFDLILAMDRSNYDNLVDMAATAEQKDKVKMILAYGNSGTTANVPDPYYGGDDGFRNVYLMIDEAIVALVNDLATN